MTISIEFGYDPSVKRGSVTVRAGGVEYGEDTRGMLRSADGAVFGWVDHVGGRVVSTMAHPTLRHQLKNKGRPGWKHTQARAQ